MQGAMLLGNFMEKRGLMAMIHDFQKKWDVFHVL